MKEEMVEAWFDNLKAIGKKEPSKIIAELISLRRTTECSTEEFLKAVSEAGIVIGPIDNIIK